MVKAFRWFLPEAPGRVPLPTGFPGLALALWPGRPSAAGVVGGFPKWETLTFIGSASPQPREVSACVFA